VSTPRWNSRTPRLQGLWGHPPADQPIHSDTGSLDSKSPKTSHFSVIRRFIGIESHASESYYHSYTVATSGVHRLASQICHNRLFRKKLQQKILPLISTEVSSLAAHNRSQHGKATARREKTPQQVDAGGMRMMNNALWIPERAVGLQLRFRVEAHCRSAQGTKRR
jgi:hypothetical protein